MNMSPLAEMATSVGLPNVSSVSPATPALPNVSKSFPSGLNLKTCSPLPLSAFASVNHRSPFFARPRHGEKRTFPHQNSSTACPMDRTRERRGDLNRRNRLLPNNRTPQNFLPG